MPTYYFLSLVICYIVSKSIDINLSYINLGLLLNVNKYINSTRSPRGGLVQGYLSILALFNKSIFVRLGS